MDSKEEQALGRTLRQRFAETVDAVQQASSPSEQSFGCHLTCRELRTVEADMQAADLLAACSEQSFAEEFARARQADAEQSAGLTSGACVQITQHRSLCSNSRTLQRLIEMRAPFLNPINILQVLALLSVL